MEKHNSSPLKESEGSAAEVVNTRQHRKAHLEFVKYLTLFISNALNIESTQSILAVLSFDFSYWAC